MSLPAGAVVTTADFYKSMTTHVDHTIWQDVYRPSTAAGHVYLKLMVIDDVLIVSFKEL
ncbi:MAG TPA: type II toxin-antitoxin system MqsR family toxin [Rhodoferax sp.]